MKKKTSARKPARAKRSAKPTTSKTAAAGLPLIGFPLVGEIWPKRGGRFAGLLRNEAGRTTAPVVIDPKLWPKAAWGNLGRIAGADSEYDGLANTKAMAAAGNELAKKVLAMKVDGHGDIFIAAPRQARLAFINGCLPKDLGWVWTSSQYRDWDDGAWAQDCSDGFQGGYRKSGKFPVVLVRSEVIR